MLFWGAILLLAALNALETTGAPAVETRPGCETSPAMVGGTGSMTFHFRQGLNMSSDIFHAYVIRIGDTANVLQCDRRNEAGITCETINQAFKTTSIVNHSLRLHAPNVTLDLAGNYTLWTLAGGLKELPVECKFVVKNETEGSPGDQNITIVATVVPIACIVLAIGVTAGVIYARRRLKKGSDEGDGSSPLLPHNPPADVADKRWYFGHMPAKAESKLPRFERNGPGSFLIREESGKYLILAVCGEDRQNKRFRIKTEAGYTIEGSNNTFDTLTQLVNNYRTNDMILDGISFGKLGTSFEVKPKEEWYAGELTREEEQTLFESKGQERGSFLIRNNITFPGFYTLAVNIGGDTKHFRISLDENCFELCDANKTFKSLAELVNHYQTNDIETHEGNFGRLGSPIRAGCGGEKYCCLFNNII